MNTSLSHLPQYKQSQLREITQIIVKAVDPEQVILFGSHATGRWVEQCNLHELYTIRCPDIRMVLKAESCPSKG